MKVSEALLILKDLPPNADVCFGGYELFSILDLKIRNVYRSSHSPTTFYRSVESPSEHKDQRTQVVEIITGKNKNKW